MSDADLVCRVRQGDAEAFGTLVRRYERSVRALVLSQLRDLDRADDAAQATFVLAYRRLATLRDAGRFGPWLMQIARRQVVEAVRARRIAVPIPSDLATENPAATAWVEHEHLLRLVDRLPADERWLIGLRYFDNLSHSEIAEISGRPLGSVTKQLSRAIARLRGWYEQENNT